MATNMTREEFYEKYGDVEVVFVSYYKCTFTHEAMLPNGRRLTVGYGGGQDEIYRYKVTAGLKERIKSLQPYTGAVYEGSEEIESFYDF